MLDKLVIIIFGDSFTDTSNVYTLIKHTWCIVPPFCPNGVRALLTVSAKNLLTANQAFPYMSQLNQTALVTAITASGNNGVITSLSIIQQIYTDTSTYMFVIHALIINVILNTVDRWCDL
jgi:hypothetical protein